MGYLEVLHEKESKLLHEIKSWYQTQATSNTSKINNLKMVIHEMQTKTEMNTKRIKVLLTKNMERFNHQLKQALDQGWAQWANQTTELHTYRVD